MTALQDASLSAMGTTTHGMMGLGWPLPAKAKDLVDQRVKDSGQGWGGREGKGPL